MTKNRTITLIIVLIVVLLNYFAGYKRGQIAAKREAMASREYVMGSFIYNETSHEHNKYYTSIEKFGKPLQLPPETCERLLFMRSNMLVNQAR